MINKLPHTITIKGAQKQKTTKQLNEEKIRLYLQNLKKQQNNSSNGK